MTPDDVEPRAQVGSHGWLRALAAMPPGYAAVLVLLLATAATIALTGTNVVLFQALQRYSRVVPDPLFVPFWQSATYAGDGLAAVALSVLLLWHRPQAVWAALVGVIPGTMLLNGLKALLAVDRPALVLMNQGVTVLGPALHHGSFPSGHSVAAGLLAGTIVLAFRNPWVRVTAGALALVVGLSRAAVGVHWPTDIATGLAIGWLSAWIGWCIAAQAPWSARPVMRIVAAVVIAVCGLLLFRHPMGLPEAAPFRYALAVLAIVLALAGMARGVAEWRAAGSASS